MFIPIRTDSPVKRTPYVNYALIVINVAAFLTVELSGSGLLMRLESEMALSGRWPELYQFFTYQFLHSHEQKVHLIGNMLFLWVFGNAVNGKMGHVPYLLFYLAGGVFSAVGYALFSENPMIGASGSIAAVTAAYLALFPRSYITFLYWFFFIGTIELPSMIMIIFKMILYDNLIEPALRGGGQVAYSAHLAGYVFGLAASVAMLLVRALPRDQFDILALWRRWYQRRTFADATSSPEAQARAQYGRVARPVEVRQVDSRPLRDMTLDKITELRAEIGESLAQNDRTTAANLYEQMIQIDSDQVLSHQQQLDVANQLYTLNRPMEAAAAYEKYLVHYRGTDEYNDVQLLLGIIYARDLQQYQAAEKHLGESLGKWSDERRREQCRQWLEVALQALGRPLPDA